MTDIDIRSILYVHVLTDISMFALHVQECTLYKFDRLEITVSGSIFCMKIPSFFSLQQACPANDHFDAQ
jgi:hypothetical protein